MRLFVALDIDEVMRDRIGAFITDVSALAPGARWVRPESLHVTLKFIGWIPDDRVDEVKRAISTVRGEPMTLGFGGCGFFPTPRSARVFWIGIEAPSGLASLAAAIEAELVPLGVEKEQRRFSPHLTLARGGGGSGSPRRQRSDRANRDFERLQKKLVETPAPEFGTMQAAEFFLYQSQLSPAGARYSKLARFTLG
jgi:2'-5' RNA ligase